MMRRVWMTGLALTQALVLAGTTFARDENGGGSGGRNDPALESAPIVILVSVDGYRWDFPERFPTPAIRRLMGDGVRAERLIPVWPTLTFPNHYSLVTGLTPARHGIVGNTFPDPGSDRRFTLRDRDAVTDGGWYGGEPLWVSAERAGMVAASYYWVGSEAEILGVRPTHWKPYDKAVPEEARVNQVLAWLDEPPDTRPHLITLYFEGVDDNAHWYGVGSDPFREALDVVDKALERLLNGIDRLPGGKDIYLALVSDHGQMAYEGEAPFVLENHLYLEGLTLLDLGPAVHAWQDTPDPAAATRLADTVNAAWRRGRAFTRASAPEDWGLTENDRFPHLVFQADPGYAVLSRHEHRRSITPGDHGWAPDAPEMHGVFMARGPGIDAGSERGPLHVTSVQGIVLEWLDLATDDVPDSRPEDESGPERSQRP